MSSVSHLWNTPRVFAIVAIAFSLSGAWFCWNIWLLRLPQFSFHAIFNYVCYFSLGLVVVVIGVTIWLNEPKGDKVTVRRMLAVILLLCITLGADACIREKHPLRLCFWSGRSSLDQFADQVHEEQRDDPADLRVVDKTIGGYRIASAYVVNQAVILRLDDRGEDHLGRYAFVRIPSWDGGEVATERYGFDRFDSGVMHLSGEWFVFYDYYYSLKTGWS